MSDLTLPLSSGLVALVCGFWRLQPASVDSSSTYHLLRGHKTAKEVHDLIEFNPFHNQTKPPKFIKVDHYEYKFAPLDHQDKKACGIRRYLKEYLPPLSLENESLQNFIGKRK